MEKVKQTVQEQPKPLPLKRPHASFLEDFTDQLPSIPSPKRHRPDSAVFQWLESISGSGSHRERHCRSDTLLSHSDGKLIPRRLTKSAPNMNNTRDTDGSVMPSTPARSYRANAASDSWDVPSATPSNNSGASTSSSRRRTLVEDPYYRDINLATNNIYLRSSREQYPEHVVSLVDNVRMDRDSPGPSPDQVWQDLGLEGLEMGTGESEVEDYFKGKVFIKPAPLDSLRRIDKSLMARQVVPDVRSKLRVSTPVPDMLYGYSRNGAFFPEGQKAQLLYMGTEMTANSQGLIYPFLVIEFKADGPGGCGGIWVATNQCLGGSASCVNIAERLNHQLRHCKNEIVQPIDSTAFSIAMNGTEARLYISWKHDELKFYMAKVDSFLLQKPKDYIHFRKTVLNIIDWGKGKRLKDIQKSLDSLLEENRQMASQLAKSRPPPSDDSPRSGSPKRID